MPPPRARQHLLQPLSRRARHTTTTTALPNSGLGSARPFVRWINLRACPASGSSFVMESASRNDRLPRDRTNRMAPSPRSPEAASTAGAFFSNLDRCLAVDPMLGGSGSRGHRQGSGRATSSALTVPGKRNERLVSIDGNNCIFQTYTRPTPATPWHNLHCRRSRSPP